MVVDVNHPLERGPMGVSSIASFGPNRLEPRNDHGGLIEGAVSGSKDLSALSAGHPDNLSGRMVRRGKDKRREHPSNTSFFSLYPLSILARCSSPHLLYTFTPSHIIPISPCLSTKSTVPPPLSLLVQTTSESMARVLPKTRTNLGPTGTLFAHGVNVLRAALLKLVDCEHTLF